MEKSNGRYLFGILIITFGVIALLNNFGFTSISLGYVFNLAWPLLFVIAGVNLITRKDLAALATGAVLISLGVLWFGRNAGLFDVDMSQFWKGFWPVLIIVIGLNILFKNGRDSEGNTAIMGSVEKTREPWDLKDAEYTAIMGGIDLDIRQAIFTKKEITLNLSAIMGGITVVVPADAAVTCTGTAILGGVDLMGRGSGGIVGSTSMQSGDLQNSDKILHLKCTTIMGGIEIKR